jgi:diguanylate cyclase (GGDEF)-like protein/PAS domain S-box-containing protein
MAKHNTDEPEDDTDEEETTNVPAAPPDPYKSRRVTRTVDIGGPSPKRVFDQVSIMAVVLDTRLRVVRYNAAAERLFARPFQDVLNRDFNFALKPIAAINRDNVLKRVLKEERSAEVKEVEVQQSLSGTTVFYDFVIDPIRDDEGHIAGISLIGLEVSERTRLRRRLTRQNEDLLGLQRVGQALRKTIDLDKAFFIIASSLTSHEAGAYERALILTVDQDREFLVGKVCTDSVGLGHEIEEVWRRVVSHDGPLKQTLEAMIPAQAEHWATLSNKAHEVRIPLSEDSSLMVHAIRTGQTVTHDTLLRDKSLRLYDELRRRFDMTCFAAAPLLAENEAIGVIIVDSTLKPRDFTPESLKLLEMFADQAALAISTGMMFQDVLSRAQKDSLTGLFNHGHFQDVLRSELEKAQRYKSEVSVIMLDLDHFKPFNDTHGHQAGDAALKQVAMLLSAVVRVTDLPARYGGEEFAVVLPHTGYKGALELAERVRQGIERKVQVKTPKGEKVGVTASLGVSTFPRHATDPGTLVAAADEAMYLAKDRGRNNVAGADEADIEVEITQSKPKARKPKRTMTVKKVRSVPEPQKKPKPN